MIDFNSKLYLVGQFVKRFLGSRPSWRQYRDDIEQEARISLWRAVEQYSLRKFDPKQGTVEVYFNGYALRAMELNSIRMVQKLLNPFNKVKSYTGQVRLDATATNMEGETIEPVLPEALTTSPERAIHEAIDANRYAARVQAHNTRPDRAGNAAQGVDTSKRNAEIAHLLITGEATASECARKFGISRERVRQIKNTFRFQVCA